MYGMFANIYIPNTTQVRADIYPYTEHLYPSFVFDAEGVFLANF